MVHVEITQIDFFSEHLQIEFDVLCDLCGQRRYETSLTIKELTKLVVGCSHCEDKLYPSFIKPLYDTLIETVTDYWRYSPEDIRTIEEQLHRFLISTIG
jgi:hypothetical protein